MTDTAPSALVRKPLLWSAALLMLLMFGAGAAQLWHIVSPPRTETATVDPNCNLHEGSCTATFSDGSQLTISVTPQPIAQQRPLSLNVQSDGLNIASMEADIVGIGMNMGYNRPALSAGTDTQYQGQAILPVCVLTEMPWELRLMAHTTDRGLLVAPFRFTTNKNAL